MPELPEVQTVADALKNMVSGATLRKIEFLWPKIAGNVPAETMANQLVGQTIRDVTRRAKYILIRFDEDTLIVHLRMEGRFYVKQETDLIEKHSHVLLYLNDGRRVEYNDTRKFGRFYYYKKEDNLTVLDGLGYEPFDPELNAKILFKATRHKKTQLKIWLLNQSNIAGIGNIYADEICYACRLSPKQPVGRISLKQWEDILNQTRFILGQAILAGGTTVRTYVSTLGVSGRFQFELHAYGQKGKPCATCGTPLKRIVVGQRGTVYCPSCQKVR